MTSFLFGKLTLNALPHEWFTIGGTVSIIGGVITVVLALTYFKKWSWLWNNWLTSTDPKRIGVMYIVVASLMLFRGALDAGMIWLQQILSHGSSNGYLTSDHFQQIFTAHGDIMVFFVTMGFLFGLMNIIVPLQIGARDLASPFLNTLGFWLYVAGAILINFFFIFGGQFAAAGWLAQAPLSELQFSPGVGIDYWIWSLQISGLGTLLGGINFMMTIFKKRAPGMTLMRMPMFTWASLCSSFLIISVFPILAMTINLLFLDRFLGMHFFTTDFGGNPMMYTNLIWSWGHPEVYILVIPSFGAYSDIVSTLSRKKIYGYVSMVASLIGITLMSLLVWLHHFFTMGSGADVNAFFGIMTGIIAIPTGAQVFNWLFTMRGGQIRFYTPMKWFLAFVATFTLGGMAGVMMSVPGIDYEVHNSLFLVAHFHTMVFGAALFGIFAAITFWFPKIFGFKLNEKWGTRAFWFWLIGFWVAFAPLYILGFMGATRRLDHYDASLGWQWLFMISAFGLFILAIGALFQVIQIIVSFLERNKPENLDLTGDPWNGRSLEWSTHSPVPFYNFAVIPEVNSRDAFWEMKKNSKENLETTQEIKYQDIEMPKNTAMGIYISAFAFLVGFGFVWHIIWLVCAGFIGAITCAILYSLDENTEHVIPASEIARIEKEYQIRKEKWKSI